jgi:hypothetical protein
MSTRYVQHVSGQGEKWEVLEETQPQGLSKCWTVRDTEFLVRAKDNPRAWHILPKSEYRLVEPPERWVDVTARCTVEQGAIYHNGKRMFWDNGFRPVLKQGKSINAVDWCFLVERREP